MQYGYIGTTATRVLRLRLSFTESGWNNFRLETATITTTLKYLATMCSHLVQFFDTMVDARLVDLKCLRTVINPNRTLLL